MRAAIAVLLAAAAWAAEPAPVFVYAGAGGEAWMKAAAARSWEVVSLPEALPDDASARSVAAALESARKRRDTDPARTYLAGAGMGTASVLYLASRLPGVWAAALAGGGNPTPAIDTNRLFGANAELVPVLWAAASQDEAVLAPVRRRLHAAGFDIQFRTDAVTIGSALDWLAAHRSDPFPPKVDCETGNPEFARCYWASIAKFDPAQRNDVLPSSRVVPGSGARLALGGFGYSTDAPGPGVVITWLQPGYSGRLRLEDRIVSIGGRAMKDPQDYVAFMASQQDDKNIAVVIERGRERVRLETRIVIPRREENFTARVQAEFLQESRELQVISRGVSGLRLTLPAFWTPSSINWNGVEAGKPDAAGCWVLVWGAQARKCE